MRSALGAGRALAAGELDPVALCEAALAAARAAPAVFTLLTEERARREAAASAARLRAGTPRGPLDGVPVAWKDLVDVAGTPTTAASALRRDAPPAAADAPVVAALAAAGMVCVGKTNLSELAFSGLGTNPHFGTPPNPRAPGRVPGGSSSGSAVAVAAGIVPVAIGTDTAGSIRVPAAFCRVAGFKPSAARIDRTGLLPLAPTLDSIGPLATCVADLIAVDAALRGAVPGATAASGAQLVVPRASAPTNERRCSSSSPRASSPTTWSRRSRRASPRTWTRSRRRACRCSGARSPRSTAHARCSPSTAAWSRTRHGAATWRCSTRWTPTRPMPVKGAQRETASTRPCCGGCGRGARCLQRATTRSLRERPGVQAALADELAGALIALPAVPHEPPEIAPLLADTDRFLAVNARTLRTTLPLSFLDAPGVTLPSGLLLSGPSGADERVLAAALVAEQALDA